MLINCWIQHRNKITYGYLTKKPIDTYIYEKGRKTKVWPAHMSDKGIERNREKRDKDVVREKARNKQINT